MTRLQALLIGAVLTLGASSNLMAMPIELNGGVGAFQGFGPGSGRAIGILADEDFALSSLGFFGDLPSKSFDALLYSSTNGSDTTGVAASNTAVVGGAGLAWYDINLAFNLMAGSFYVVHFRPSDGIFDLGAGGYEFFDDDANLPVDVGPITVLDGAEGFSAPLSFGNSVHARMRVTSDASSVPNPATLALLGLGLAGLGFRRRVSR